MKPFYLLPVALIGLSFAGDNYFSTKLFSPVRTDSGFIAHKLNGSTDEWPADKFTADKETSILYAIDNNAQNLYLALKIPSHAEEIKMMRMGMKLFIDLKGKHKENMGVEFPVKKVDGTGNPGTGVPAPQSNGQSNEQERKPDFKKIRMMLALNIISMNLFGFGEGDQLDQNLETEGSVQIAYNWDSTDVIQIEYLLPLKMLGDINSLNQKMVSIGWKVNGMEIPSGSSSFSGRPGGGGSSGGRPSGGSGGGRPGSGGGQADFDKMMKEQLFWTKYTFMIPVELKGF